MADKKQYATVRERVCANEELFLSKYAVRSADTKGRLREEASCDFRTEFQRDSKANIEIASAIRDA